MVNYCKFIWAPAYDDGWISRQLLIRAAVGTSRRNPGIWDRDWDGMGIWCLGIGILKWGPGSGLGWDGMGIGTGIWTGYSSGIPGSRDFVRISGSRDSSVLHLVNYEKFREISVTLREISDTFSLKILDKTVKIKILWGKTICFDKRIWHFTIFHHVMDTCNEVNWDLEQNFCFCFRLCVFEFANCVYCGGFAYWNSRW